VTTVKDGSVDSPLSLDSTRQGGKPAVHPTCPVCGQTQCECPPGAQEVVRTMMEQRAMTKCGDECAYVCQQPDGFGWCGKRAPAGVKEGHRG
jgi:hypothetical protein